MKKATILFTFFIFIFSAVQAQKGNAFLIYKDCLMFVNAMPTQEYEVVGKAQYKNSKSNEQITKGDVCGLAKVILALDDVYKDVEKGKQARFDAAIVKSPIKIELVTFKTDITTYRKCNVGVKEYSKKCGSKTMYLWSKPTTEYEVVKVLDVKNFTNLGQLKMGKNDIDNFLNKLYERSCKEAKAGVDFDAILFNDSDVINKRGFITIHTIDLIKFQ